MENKNRVNLNNMLDNLYCEVYESTNNCTVLWNYNTYKIVDWSWLVAKIERRINICNH